jgi:mono/diheme cytochrome c family protein
MAMIEIHQRHTLALLLAGVLYGYAGPSASQNPGAIASGKLEFQTSCAVCHGNNAAGNGPMAAVLNVPPADLTTLAKNNNGAFPFLRVIETIDGRYDTIAHGGRDMPIWGIRYRENQDPALARARILDLTLYLESIQDK